MGCLGGALGFPGGSVVKKIHQPMQEAQVQYLGLEDPMEKEMAIHSSILACKIPQTRSLAGTKESDRT